MDSVRCDAFIEESKDGEYLEVKNSLLHCLFEGQLFVDYMVVLGKHKLKSNQVFLSSPLDRYVLGYCIANCSSTTSWKVCLDDGSGESFMWGLNSSNSGKGIINCLEILNIHPKYFDSYPSTILSRTDHLSADSHDSSMLIGTSFTSDSFT